jgi:hypothetical protein
VVPHVGGIEWWARIGTAPPSCPRVARHRRLIALGQRSGRENDGDSPMASGWRSGREGNGESPMASERTSGREGDKDLPMASREVW